ncbi:acidic phospholipase A2 CM-II-like [Clarias gariepinus]|uniref:acidic phospholipase A2 CM-II-like n=1 Tax=Clarias gariepinus TaxID=13013 RepID=UPI00234E024A|nr:acidic phospholipase A2 CM-II-like [Clarias gariepinus]
MHLSWILLLTSVCMVCGEIVPRILWQVSEMIVCTQPNVNPFIYSNYGCYCGFSGSGSPKDPTDQCCAMYNMCYENARQLLACSAYKKQLNIKTYFFSCSAKIITCSGNNDKCQSAVCKCDRGVANCFAQYQHTFSYEYYYLPKEMCKK